MNNKNCLRVIDGRVVGGWRGWVGSWGASADINRNEVFARRGINQRRAFVAMYCPIKHIYHINGIKLTKSHLSNG